MNTHELFRKILGIDCLDGQEPNLYVLLGLTLFESDGREIHKAALRQMKRLKEWQIHPDVLVQQAVQEMLNRVSMACTVLEVEVKKEEYDRRLALELKIELAQGTDYRALAVRVRLRRCPNCGNEVSDLSILCINCGYHFEKKEVIRTRIEEAERDNCKIGMGGEPESAEFYAISQARDEIRGIFEDPHELFALAYLLLLIPLVLICKAFYGGPLVVWIPVACLIAICINPSLRMVTRILFFKGFNEALKWIPESYFSCVRKKMNSVPAWLQKKCVENGRRGASFCKKLEIGTRKIPSGYERLTTVTLFIAFSACIAWFFLFPDNQFDRQEVAASASEAQTPFPDSTGTETEQKTMLEKQEHPRDFQHPWNVDSIVMELLPVQVKEIDRPDKKNRLQPFWIGKYEVTQKQYESVSGNNPSRFPGKNRPVESISWNDAAHFCSRLTEMEQDRLPEGYVFRLPTETEWEYAASGGNQSKGNAFSGPPDDVAWYGKNSGECTHPVGEKTPNELGLHDVSGNVWEWCLGKEEGGKIESGISRGGCWKNLSASLKLSNRRQTDGDESDAMTGFRVVLASLDSCPNGFFGTNLKRGLIIQYSFEPGQIVKRNGNTMVKNLCGPNLWGNLIGVKTVNGDRGKGVHFENGARIEIPGLRNQIVGLNELTISCRFRIPADSGTVPWVFDVGHLGHGSLSLHAFGVLLVNETWHANKKAEFEYRSGRWTTLTFACGSKTLRLHHDGKKIAEADRGGRSFAMIGQEEACIGSQAKDYMRQQDRRWLTGDLDEFSVWNRVLDEKEVRQLY